jgi:hypothetical protein
MALDRKKAMRLIRELREADERLRRLKDGLLRVLEGDDPARSEPLSSRTESCSLDEGAAGWGSLGLALRAPIRCAKPVRLWE